MHSLVHARWRRSLISRLPRRAHSRMSPHALLMVSSRLPLLHHLLHLYGRVGLHRVHPSTHASPRVHHVRHVCWIGPIRTPGRPVLLAHHLLLLLLLLHLSLPHQPQVLLVLLLTMVLLESLKAAVTWVVAPRHHH